MLCKDIHSTLFIYIYICVYCVNLCCVMFRHEAKGRGEFETKISDIT